MWPVEDSLHNGTRSCHLCVYPAAQVCRAAKAGGGMALFIEPKPRGCSMRRLNDQCLDLIDHLVLTAQPHLARRVWERTRGDHAVLHANLGWTGGARSL